VATVAVAIATVVVVVAGCRGKADDANVARVASVVALGRMVFFDPALSADGEFSCASCHRPDRAYADGLALASGTAGRQGTRNTPSLLDVARQRSLFWDGRRVRLEDQALDPLFNEVEHGLADETQLLAKLRANPRTVAAFAVAFGGPATSALTAGDASHVTAPSARATGPAPVARIAASDAQLVTAAHVAEALAAFERTLVSPPSPFDRFLAGDKDAMSAAARRGWVVFDQLAHCTRCHVATSDDGRPPLFTDHQFHSLSIGFSKVERKLPELTERLVASRGSGRPLGREVLLDSELAELGRFAITLDPRDLAAFKTPGLRNVALTAPYMHDGSVMTLADAVELEVYGRSARDARPVILTPPERDDVVAFLRALTSDDLASFHRGPGND
jgi:cytochrome c peroxidase